MEKIIVKQISNPSHPELGFKHPGAADYLPARVGEDGKVITGFDENALYILRMEDGEKKAALQKKIKKERGEIEKLLGINLDPSSSYWDGFYVVIDDELTLDPTNPKDRLIATWLVANRYAAPSEAHIDDDEDFYHCVYYLYREQEHITKTAEDQVSKDEAIAKLVSLKKGNPHQLILVVSNLLGYNAGTSLDVDAAYMKAKEFLATDTKSLKNTKLFLEVAEKSPEELMTKSILDKAIKKKLVTVRSGVHRRGDQVYGDSYEEALEYLQSVENSGELSSLKKSVEK